MASAVEPAAGWAGIVGHGAAIKARTLQSAGCPCTAVDRDYRACNVAAHCGAQEDGDIATFGVDTSAPEWNAPRSRFLLLRRGLNPGLRIDGSFVVASHTRS